MTLVSFVTIHPVYRKMMNTCKQDEYHAPFTYQFFPDHNL